MNARALPVIDLLIGDRNTAELDGATVRELVQCRATNVERVPAGGVDREHVDALARRGVRELPAGAAERRVEVCAESTADVREGGKAVEGCETYRDQVSTS